jgi:Xaa-Pro dipeptidase
MTPSIRLIALLVVATPLAAQAPDARHDFTGASPWSTIRQERIRTLLPPAMAGANVDAWVILVRENANDPLALHVGGENAGAPSGIIFLREGDRVRSVMLSGFGEAIALRELGVHDSVVVYDVESGGLLGGIAARVADAERIAINSGNLAIADGLTHTQRTSLERALGPELTARLVSSTDLVSRWLAIKLPAEVELMRRAAELTDQLEHEAYATVVPGTTRDSDLAVFLKRRMRELGVTDGWSPAQNPSVNSGPDRGHSHASDRVIQHGDVIQIDFGIKVHGVWVTDIQRFAYVLRPGEDVPPPRRAAQVGGGPRGRIRGLPPDAPGGHRWRGGLCPAGGDGGGRFGDRALEHGPPRRLLGA